MSLTDDDLQWGAGRDALAQLTRIKEVLTDLDLGDARELRLFVRGLKTYLGVLPHCTRHDVPKPGCRPCRDVTRAQTASEQVKF